jgi:serine-type D-Ala-D-Ala carboxypeptidase/endopeptidase
MFDVMREGDRLMVQLTGQAAYRVYPISEWQVFYKIVGAQITFEPGADGRATRLILHQNGRDQMADRIDWD